MKFNWPQFILLLITWALGVTILVAHLNSCSVEHHLAKARKHTDIAIRKGALIKPDTVWQYHYTLIRFEPDPDIFKEVQFRPEHVEHRLRHCSYLNTGLKLLYNGKVFQSRNGLFDLVMEDLQADGSERIYPPLHYSDKTLEFCFTHSNSRYGETFYSFVNGQYTSDGVTHLSAFREGLLKAVNEYGREKFEGDDVRESMVGAVSIRLKDPVFESQTKNKLGNTEIRTDLVNRVREELLHFFNRNKEIAEKIVTKVKDTQQLRKELQDVNKLARERAKAITLRIPQLKDCKHHFDKKKEKGP